MIPLLIPQRVERVNARCAPGVQNGMAALGQRERAFERAQRALAMASKEGMVLYNIGCIYSLLGKLDEAIGILEQAAEHGLTHRGWYEYYSNLDPLRPMHRFRMLLDRLP